MNSKGEEKEFRSIELEWKDWSDLLLKFKCLECKSTLTRLPHPDFMHLPPEKRKRYGKLGCSKCRIYYEPPKGEKVKGEARQPSLREKEKATERSGGSLYPPLPLHYFCEKCYEKSRKLLIEKNKIEAEADLPISVPTGFEGLVAIPVQQQMILKEAVTTLPFTCSCGQRRFVELTIHDRDMDEHLLFKVPIGHQTTCFNCRYAFDKGVGDNYFQFRCDFNTKCPDIKPLKEKGLVTIADETKG